jgi:hypothetical protein
VSLRRAAEKRERQPASRRRRLAPEAVDAFGRAFLYLQHTSVTQPAACFMSDLALPFSADIVPVHPVQECEYPVTRRPPPFPAGPRSPTVHVGEVLQPPHLPDGCSSIVIGAGVAFGFGAVLFQTCGPGPAKARAAKKLLATIAIEV